VAACFRFHPKSGGVLVDQPAMYSIQIPGCAGVSGKLLFVFVASISPFVKLVENSR
jgi:hypothetical protein